MVVSAGKFADISVLFGDTGCAPPLRFTLQKSGRCSRVKSSYTLYGRYRTENSFFNSHDCDPFYSSMPLDGTIRRTNKLASVSRSGLRPKYVTRPTVYRAEQLSCRHARTEINQTKPKSLNSVNLKHSALRGARTLDQLNNSSYWICQPSPGWCPW